MVRAGWAAARTTMASVGRVLHLLFLQVTGMFFLCFALVGGYAVYREYHSWTLGKAGPGKAVLAACFTVMFAWFAVSSFWRAARRSSKQ
jgi:hypothetical protein